MNINYSDKNLSKSLGQFLSPPSVAKALSKFTHQNYFSELDKEEHIIMSDIAVGTGTLLLQPLQDIYKQKPHRMNYVHVMAMDIDPNMVRMTAVQVAMSALFHGIELGSFIVYWGHAITDYGMSSQSKDTRGFVWTTNEENYRTMLKQKEISTT